MKLTMATINYIGEEAAKALYKSFGKVNLTCFDLLDIIISLPRGLYTLLYLSSLKSYHLNFDKQPRNLTIRGKRYR